MLADRLRDHPCFRAVFPFPGPAHVIPGLGLSILERAVDEAVLLPSGGLRSTSFCASERVPIGEPDNGGEFAREDRSERRVSENELSLLCLGISTAGLDTSAGPSTPVLTIYVLVSILGFGELLRLA